METNNNNKKSSSTITQRNPRSEVLRYIPFNGWRHQTSTYTTVLGIDVLKTIYPIPVKQDNLAVSWTAGLSKLWPMGLIYIFVYCPQAKNGFYIFERLYKTSKQMNTYHSTND